jgi:lipopolysaccharide transport system ATP-binding protein
MPNSIDIQNVDLYYASTAFTDTSLKSVLGKLLRGQKSALVHDIHALKNISVSIGPGERVGLLGHNGAGKSTFLKMVAGLYPITSGRREVEGTIRSLFDLSLGFEPDATGRENILYRGLLLGLTPKFMRSISDDVVEFADLGEFIDYPIKTYSAGMQVRLAFAISTAVGGDILLLDEVIGVGDANFIGKARQRILELVERAEILLLASHDFQTLRSICSRGLVFHHGQLVFDGPIAEATKSYAAYNGLA